MSIIEFTKKLFDEINKVYENKKILTFEKYMSIYVKIYDFCTYGQINQKKKIDKILLYQNQCLFYDNIIVNLTSYLNTIKSKIINSNNCLIEYNKQFKNFIIISSTINNIFEYFNKIHIKLAESIQGTKKYSFIDNCKYLWFIVILRPLNDKLFYRVYQMVNEKRIEYSYMELEPTNRYIKSLIDVCMVDNLDIYSDDNIFDNNDIYNKLFKNAFCELSLTYYKNLNISKNDQLDILTYINQVNKIINYETELCNKHINNIVLDKLIYICHDELIYKNKLYILQHFKKSLFNNHETHLKEIYNFYSKYDNDSALLKEFCEYATIHMEETLVREESYDKIYIYYTELLIKNYKYFTDLIKNMFEGNLDFINKFNIIYRKTLNVQKLHNKKIDGIDYICKYIDAQIKNSKTEILDLEDICQILIFIDDKDYFEIYYMKYLARRLLLSRCINEKDTAVFSKIKKLYALDFINKVQNMFNDLNIASNLNNEFNNKKLDVLVVTKNTWPIKSIPYKELPLSFMSEFDKFNSFYDRKYRGRKLEIHSQYSSGEIVCNCFSKKYIFHGNLEQLNILLQFNLSSIISKNNIDIKNKDNVMILKKAGLILEDENHYKLNTKYKSKKIKHNLLSYTKKKKDETEKKQDDNLIHMNRNHVIQAALVRIMKSRNILDHNNLVSESISIIDKFIPKMSDIKRNIEILIEKEYLERDIENKNTYKYIS